MTAYKVTSEDVKDFWKYMKKKYDFSVVQKADAKEMRAIAWALDMMHIKDHKAFMENYNTTIGKTVYVNFELGVGNQTDLVHQIKTCVHETQHVLQYKRNPLQFSVNYLRSDAARAHYETDAYRTTMEMHYFFTGRVLSASSLAGLLKGYSIGTGDVHVAEKHLMTSSRLVEQGVIVSGISKTAIKWWKKRIDGNKVVFA